MTTITIIIIKQYRNSIMVMLVRPKIDFNGVRKMMISTTTRPRIQIFNFELLNIFLFITGFFIFLHE